MVRFAHEKQGLTSHSETHDLQKCQAPLNGAAHTNN